MRKRHMIMHGILCDYPSYDAIPQSHFNKYESDVISRND